MVTTLKPYPSNRWRPHSYNTESDLLKPFGYAEAIEPSEDQAREMSAKFGITYDKFLELRRDDNERHCLWMNDKYQVAVYHEGQFNDYKDGYIHLSIKRIDREPINDWRVMQEIKNMLVGPDCEAVELYPAEDRLVDTANQYHLWVVNDPTYRFPIGFNEGRTVHYDDASGTGAKQKPRPTKEATSESC